MPARVSDGFACFGGEIESDEFGERRCAADDGTEPPGSQEIVSNAVPFGRVRLAGEIRPPVEKIDSHGARRVINIKGAACQGLIEIPGAADWHRCRFGPDECFNLSLRHSFEDPLQNQEIYVFVAYGKDQ